MAKELDLEDYENYDEYEDEEDFDDEYEEEEDYIEEVEELQHYEKNDLEDGEYEVIEEKSFNPGSLLSVVALLSTWFIRLGVVIAICLLIAFFVMGKVATAFLYILGLVVAFFFGYGFMFCLDHFLIKES